jgi:hypothetical protein
VSWGQMSFYLSVTVNFRTPGYHCWPDAPEHRAYLRSVHRHLFHVSVTTEVEHGERQIEFHDLQDDAKLIFSTLNDGSASCETMAMRMASQLSDKYNGRGFEVSVWEDGECGATCSYKPD